MDVIVGRELLGEESEADVSAWLVASGASVERGQPIAELETAKVKVEIQAPASGTLQILVAAGAIIEPETVIARIV